MTHRMARCDTLECRSKETFDLSQGLLYGILVDSFIVINSMEVVHRRRILNGTSIAAPAGFSDDIQMRSVRREAAQVELRQVVVLSWNAHRDRPLDGWPAPDYY